MKILHEDNHVIVVVKEAGTLTQSDDSGSDSLLDQVREYVRVKYNKPGEAFLGLVHRLDRNVGGVMVFARTSKAASRLAEQIRARTFDKQYLAVVEGEISSESGMLSDWLLKDEPTNTTEVVDANTPGAKEAKLKYQKLDSNDELTLLNIHLETGRSHQIRAQLAHKGNPLWGDAKYGAEEQGHNLGLWAYSLSFQHPTLKTELKFIELPDTSSEPWSNFGPQLAKIAA